LRLAATYALSGQIETARSLTANISTDMEAYSNMNNYIRETPLRDLAMILETLVAMEEFDKAVPLVIKISKRLRSNEWYSTQTTAYCLLAISKFAEKRLMDNAEMNFICKIDKQKGI